jgi:hypothetical protein
LLCQVFPNNCWETLIIFSQIRLDNYIFIMNMTSLAWLTVNTVSINWSETYLPISKFFTTAHPSESSYHPVITRFEVGVTWV